MTAGRTEQMSEWQELRSALRVHGPSPCQESAVPDAWFEAKGVLLAEARRGCDDCPVQPECLAYALAADEEGLWGGLTRPERTRLVAAA
ncbi:WhiB family transcriptional regulator [Blastococcus sp. TBT05-19]|uniref:WhiB family transcriptional regulator n=1 Tax=Blastococcus sp. TBT05-19 TaxID=2250581 RepID=UPI000DE81D30|nr:WhiB family transcriptional regulator [Blastococcus sp. TBT05-19]RBY94830.1 WhiB family transcriptional regulator [Blastococcus sp. TBT05-19]